VGPPVVSYVGWPVWRVSRPAAIVKAIGDPPPIRHWARWRNRAGRRLKDRQGCSSTRGRGVAFRQPADARIRHRVQPAPGECRGPADRSACQPGLGICWAAARPQLPRHQAVNVSRAAQISTRMTGRAFLLPTGWRPKTLYALTRALPALSIEPATATSGKAFTRFREQRPSALRSPAPDPAAEGQRAHAGVAGWLSRVRTASSTCRARSPGSGRRWRPRTRD
jgi:hypothetical protein